MIYPSYGVRICINAELDMVRTILGMLRVNTRQVIKYPETYYVDGNYQKCTLEPLNIPIVSYKEFIKIYEDFYEKLHRFINSLRPGDKVIIEDRRGASGLYPYSFANEMTQYSGKEMTIVDISKMSAAGYPFSNGSDKCFYMEEDDREFTWHSSMFVMPPSTPIKVLNLSDISINPLTLQ